MQHVSMKLACSRLRDGGGKSFSNEKSEKRAGAGERQDGGALSLSHFSRRLRPLSQVVRVLFSLCSFSYVPTILSESLAQATMKWTLTQHGLHG